MAPRQLRQRRPAEMKLRFRRRICRSLARLAGSAGIGELRASQLTGRYDAIPFDS